MRRATLAGVATIEHGNEATPEIFKLMAEHQVAWCPTLTAGAGPWPPAAGLDSPPVARKRTALKAAMDAGVTIINGSDVGTFSHGENARELEAIGGDPGAAGQREIEAVDQYAHREPAPKALITHQKRS